MRVIKKETKKRETYRVQFWGLNTWHDFPPKNNPWPLPDYEVAICYANWLRSHLNWKAVRVVNSNGFVKWQRGHLS